MSELKQACQDSVPGIITTLLNDSMEIHRHRESLIYAIEEILGKISENRAKERATPSPKKEPFNIVEKLGALNEMGYESNNRLQEIHATLVNFL